MSWRYKLNACDTRLMRETWHHRYWTLWPIPQVSTFRGTPEMWTPLYTGHFGLVPKVSAFRGSTVRGFKKVGQKRVKDGWLCPT